MTEQEPERRTVTTKGIRLRGGEKIEAREDYQKIPEAELKGFFFHFFF